MKNKFSLLFSVFALILTSFVSGATLAQDAAFDVISFDFDRESQCYSVGEEASITISATLKDELVKSGSLTVTFTNDGRDEVAAPLTFDLSENNPVTVTGALSFPGFLQIRATAKSADGNSSKSALAGAAFDPEKIEPGLPKPDDFDEYWNRGRAEVRSIPMDLQQQKIDSLSNESHTVYEVSFATVNDQRVYGYLSVPCKGEAPYPVIVNVPGAGPGIGPEFWLADKGFVALTMNVFPYPVSLNTTERQSMYDEFNKNAGKTYCYIDADNRDKFFFRPVYLGIDRAIDWLAEQDYVDASRIGYYGSSQGGASALILGGLNKRFCAILAAVPALCDHGGYEKGRSAGWPKLVDFYHGDANVREASQYLDAVNFARNIDQATIEITVGFIDVVCSPSSVYSAYNVIPSANKAIIHEPKLGHRNEKKFLDAYDRLLERVKNNGR